MLVTFYQKWALEVLTSEQVFSQSQFRYGFHIMEFREQKSVFVHPYQIDKKILLHVHILQEVAL